MRSLTDITVQVDKYDGQVKHSEITVSSVLYHAIEDDTAADFGHPTVNQVMAAAVQVAGVLARVALEAQLWVTYEAQRCGCPQRMEISEYGDLNHHWVDVCSIRGPESMLWPSADLGDSPCFWINVPDKSVDVWLGRVRGWLQAAITADAKRHEEPAPAAPAESPRLRIAREATS
jgi:hypothetical protein